MRVLANAVPYREIGAQDRDEEPSDEEIAAAARVDPVEFVALYDRYFPRVYGYVRMRVADEATCEDITSQVFLTALTKIGLFEERGRFGAWLFRVAQNAIYDVYRRSRTTPLPEESLADLADPADTPEQQAVATDTADRLRAVINTLPPTQRHLLALRFGAGLNSREIGRIVGKNPAAVRVSLHRILADLRRRYSDDESQRND